MNKKHIDDIISISNDYITKIKPLLEILKVRTGGKYPQNCLNEIRAINDHVARCYRDNISDEYITKEIGKAEGHLQRLAYDCYKQIIVYQTSDIKYTVKKYYTSNWPRIGDGELWDIYREKYRLAQAAEKNAKVEESINSTSAMEKYAEACNNYNCVISGFKKFKRQILCYYAIEFLKRLSKGVYWLIITVTLTIIVALLDAFGF